MLRYTVAIIGAGPAGYFAAQALQDLRSDDREFAIDMFEKLPTPWGLVRSGVAPDHPKIKSVSKVFERIATQDGFRLLANVNVGVDISLDELQASYDAVVVAIGTPKGKSLGIPGEGLKNVISSADFVYWYNGHPEYCDLDVDLSGSRAIVIGAGNVAMDVGRILSLDPKELDYTDIAEHSLKALHTSNIRSVDIVARRGAERVAFTSSELRDLQHIASVDVKIRMNDIERAIERAGESIEKHVQSNLDTMKMIAGKSESDYPRSLRFLFEHRPLNINGDGRVESVTFNTPKGLVEVPCDLVITAIGYAPTDFSGLSLEADHYDNEDGWIRDNLYVVGWAKRGPQGVIGSNKSDATKVMTQLVNSLASRKSNVDVLAQLLKRGVRVVLQHDWDTINATEIKNGNKLGRPRLKFTRVEEMLLICGGANGSLEK
jgi:ferredoxin--NADP+ reductase